MVHMMNPGKVFPRERAEEYHNRCEQVVEKNNQGIQTVREAAPFQF